MGTHVGPAPRGLPAGGVTPPGPTAALTGWGAGLPASWRVNYPADRSASGGVPPRDQVSVPLAMSPVLYVVIGWAVPAGAGDDVVGAP